MNWRAIRAVIRKDLKSVTSNRLVWLPMIIVPVLLDIVLPVAMILLPQWVGPSAFDTKELEPLLRAIPGNLDPSLPTLEPSAQWAVISANYIFAPMFLIVPLMVTSILAADSLVGEKERKTLEALLYTPMSDAEIFVAKTLVSLIPAQIISLGSFILYGIAANIAGYKVVGELFFPRPNWWPIVFWLSPAFSIAGLGAMVMISSRSKSFVQAQQIAGVLILPIVAWMIAQSSGLFFLGIGAMLWAGLFIWVVGLWLVWVGARTFSREKLITQI